MSKELAVVTLTKIFTLVQPYQTLIREIATPNIPAFITACIQIIKPKATSQSPPAPLSFIETVCDAFSTLIPMYPATFRPSSSHIRSAVRIYLAPTLMDDVAVPESLQRAARQLVVALPFVAAKSGGSEEWAKLISGALQEFHTTADEVLRAVNESWESTSGQIRPKVDVDGEPSGGSTSLDNLPPWSGLDAGIDRLIGLFHYLAAFLQCPTKAAVVVPLSSLMDTVSRVCLIARMSPKSQSWEQSLETNAAISRDEKDDLWSRISEIHIASMQLIISLVQKLGKYLLSLVPEMLDHLVRIFKSGISTPAVRITGYLALNEILRLAGPTLSKQAVDMLDPLIGACCRDLQQDAGFLKQAEKPSAINGKDSKKGGSAAINTDLFLQPQAAVISEAPSLGGEHKCAASALLTTILSSLHQPHLKPILRGLMDKTAILTRSREAMIASVLNPYRDQRGRTYPSILPHLSRQFPNDQGVEVLRSNLHTSSSLGGGNDMCATIDEVLELEEEDEGSNDDEEMPDQEGAGVNDESTTETIIQSLKPGVLPAAPGTEVDLPIQSNPFMPKAANRATSPPKRKHDGLDSLQPKRQNLKSSSPSTESKETSGSHTGSVLATAVDDEDDSDGESDGSVHLNMVLEEEEEDEDDDDDDAE